MGVVISGGYCSKDTTVAFSAGGLMHKSAKKGLVSKYMGF